MQLSAVNVSLTAGDRARIAISTSWSTAKTGSWLRVRWLPVTCARSRALVTAGAAEAGRTWASGRPATTKWPGRESSSITDRRGDSTQDLSAGVGAPAVDPPGEPHGAGVDHPVQKKCRGQDDD